MSKLELSDIQVRQILDVYGVKSHKRKLGEGGLAILAVRDADGDGNEAGVFDDRFYAVSPTAIRAVQGNTDPSNPWAPRRATMETGQIVTYRAGKHKWRYPAPRGYAAFRQVSKAWFRRNGVGREFSNIAANIHRGAASGGTSSEACQTVPFGLWGEFRDFCYIALGVTESQVLANPLGIGPVYEYLICSRADVDAALKQSKKVVAQKPTPSEAAPVYRYILPDGKQITGVQMVVGEGYAPTRATLAAMLDEEPEKLAFRRADGDDEGPDLFFLHDGKEFPIRVLDADADRTMGRITDMASACGFTHVEDRKARTVTFSRKAK